MQNYCGIGIAKGSLMKLTSFIRSTILLFMFCVSTIQIHAITDSTYQNLIGFAPAVFFDPHDSIKATDVNILPFSFERKMSKYFRIQIRPILNYRFHSEQSGLSHIGGTVLNVSALNITKSGDFKFLLSPFYSFLYNRMNGKKIVTGGFENGIVYSFSNRLSLHSAIQWGVGYSKYTISLINLALREKLLKPHVGVVFHLTYKY